MQNDRAVMLQHIQIEIETHILKIHTLHCPFIFKHCVFIVHFVSLRWSRCDAWWAEWMLWECCSECNSGIPKLGVMTLLGVTYFTNGVTRETPFTIYFLVSFIYLKKKNIRNINDRFFFVLITLKFYWVSLSDMSCLNCAFFGSFSLPWYAALV